MRSPRDAFREAAANQLIDTPTHWFQFIDKRNLTVHTYEERIAREVTQIFPIFSQEMHIFIQRMLELET